MLFSLFSVFCYAFLHLVRYSVIIALLFCLPISPFFALQFIVLSNNWSTFRLVIRLIALLPPPCFFYCLMCAMFDLYLANSVLFSVLFFIISLPSFFSLCSSSFVIFVLTVYHHIYFPAIRKLSRLYFDNVTKTG